MGALSTCFYSSRTTQKSRVFSEQWRDQKALDSHIAHLQSLLGPPGAGGRIPKAFLDMCEKASAVRYRPLVTNPFTPPNTRLAHRRPLSQIVSGR